MITIIIYLKKRRAKQKHLLPYRITNNKLKIIFLLIIKFKISNKFKEIDIKSLIYYFYEDMVNIKILVEKESR